MNCTISQKKCEHSFAEYLKCMAVWGLIQLPQGDLTPHVVIHHIIDVSFMMKIKILVHSLKKNAIVLFNQVQYRVLELLETPLGHLAARYYEVLYILISVERWR